MGPRSGRTPKNTIKKHVKTISKKLSKNVVGTDWRPRGGSRRAWSWPRAGISSKYLAILVPNWALLGLPMRWLVVSWASGLAAPALGPAQGGLQTGSLRLRKAPGLAASAQVTVRAGLQTGSLWLRWKSSLSVEARIPAWGVLQKGCLRL